MSQNVNGHSRILDMRPQFGTELDAVGDGRVHAGGFFFLKRFIAQKIQQDTEGYKIVPLTNLP